MVWRAKKLNHIRPDREEDASGIREDKHPLEGVSGGRLVSLLRRLWLSRITASVFPLIVAFTAVIAVRGLYGLLFFPILGTEDNYQLLVFGNTVYETGALLNSYASLEPRIQNAPPMIPLLLAGFLLLAPGQGVMGMLFFAFLGQVGTLYFIFRILHSLGLRSSWSILGSLMPLLSYRFVWVTSLSTPDSLLVGLGALSGWLFVKSVGKGYQPIYLFANFATLVVLSWTHSFGVLLGLISVPAYLVVFALYYRRQFLIHVIVGTAAWALLILPRLVFITALYGAGTATGLSEPDFLAGLPFLESLPSFYGEWLLLLLAPIGVLSVLAARESKRGILLFPLWLGLTILVLAIIPDSFSHRSRYPLQFLTPLIVIIATGLAWIYIRLVRLTLPKRLQRFRKHIAFGLVVALVTPALLALSSEAPASLSIGKDFLEGSYGLRESIGRSLKEDYPTSSFLYRYWPSIITGYGGLPSENLIDFVILAKNNENIVEVALERGVSHFFFDRLSGTSYPFDERARNLLDQQTIGLTEVDAWRNGRAVLYRINQPGAFMIETILASQPEFSGENFSATQILRILGRGTMIRPSDYAYRTLESATGSLNLRLNDLEGGGSMLFFIAINMRSGASLSISVSCGGHEVANKTIQQPPSTIQVWWFDYHSLELNLEGSACSSLQASLETDSPGNVSVHKVQIIKLGAQG